MRIPIVSLLRDLHARERARKAEAERITRLWEEALAANGRAMDALENGVSLDEAAELTEFRERAREAREATEAYYRNYR